MFWICREQVGDAKLGAAHPEHPALFLPPHCSLVGGAGGDAWRLCILLLWHRAATCVAPIDAVHCGIY